VDKGNQHRTESDDDQSGQRQAHGADSPTRLIAPVLAGFSLPAIITFASGTYPGPPRHNIILSLLIAGAGLFMASIQLSIGPIYDKYAKTSRSLRGGFTLLGVCLVVVALFVLCAPLFQQWWSGLALIVLLIGGILPAFLTAYLWIQEHSGKRPAGHTRIRSSDN
jgi:MFS family permease